jgi:hypothetical protein
MLLLAALALSAPAQPRLEAVAAVRIERPSIAASQLWEKLPKARRKEVRIRDEQGRELLLRLVENE